MDAVLSLAEALIFGIVFTFVFRIRDNDLERSVKVDYMDRYANHNLMRNTM